MLKTYKTCYHHESNSFQLILPLVSFIFRSSNIWLLECLLFYYFGFAVSPICHYLPTVSYIILPDPYLMIIGLTITSVTVGSVRAIRFYNNDFTFVDRTLLKSSDLSLVNVFLYGDSQLDDSQNAFTLN